ncbi:MAG: hypothetical protein HC765_13870 [Brachymonas sp.]|nr:hypothetical protein [Brachymonas sp.]
MCNALRRDRLPDRREGHPQRLAPGRVVEERQQPEDRHQVTRKLGSFKTSMLQDAESGRAIELDALVSSVQEIGRLTQTPTPYTDALLGITRVFARQRGLYPA